ncbi:MAG: 30S ribosomal protein S16 [Candidatus Peribacteria bacterium]|nr:MAG: 30S ribosomal protein S16 [Candidatus Peribacteria bacterium]
MLKIRLSRAGKRNTPFFRVVLTDHARAASHGYKEVLGFYNPMNKEFNLKDVEKVKKYMSHGVQLSERMKKLVKANNISL